MLNEMPENCHYTTANNQSATHAYFTTSSKAGEPINVLHIKSCKEELLINGGQPFSIDISLAPNNDELGRIEIFIKHAVKAYGFDSRVVQEVSYWAMGYIGVRANYRLRQGAVTANHHYISMNFTGSDTPALFIEGAISAHLYKDNQELESLGAKALHEWLIAHPNTAIYQTPMMVDFERGLMDEDYITYMDAIAITLTSTAATATERFIDKLEQIMVRGNYFDEKGISVPSRSQISEFNKLGCAQTAY